jgi:hypothetical protein
MLLTLGHSQLRTFAIQNVRRSVISKQISKQFRLLVAMLDQQCK